MLKIYNYFSYEEDFSLEIEALNILEADKIFEEITGINLEKDTSIGVVIKTHAKS